MRDHSALQGASAGQEQQLGQAREVQSQLEALGFGTKKLADQGGKDAEAIIARMQQSGISVGKFTERYGCDGWRALRTPGRCIAGSACAASTLIGGVRAGQPAIFSGQLGRAAS